jgi:hypothetical protein
MVGLNISRYKFNVIQVPCSTRRLIILYVFLVQQPLVGQGHLIFETSRSHSDTPHSVGLLLQRKVLYLTIHNTYKRKTSITSAGFEHAISASERRQTHALDRGPLVSGKYTVFNPTNCKSIIIIICHL